MFFLPDLPAIGYRVSTHVSGATMLRQLKEDEMSHEETLAGIADGLLDEFGEELTKSGPEEQDVEK